jgi:hypothetical protein
VRRYGKIAVLVLTVSCLAGCGETAGNRTCTMIGASAGVSLRIAAPLAAEVDHASMKVCWDGVCREPTLILSPSTTTGPQTCSGQGPAAACGVSAVPDGGRYGFGDVPGLPKKPVRVTLVLTDAKGRRVLDRNVDVTPKGTFPNGPDCSELDPQAGVVAENGLLREGP